MKNIRVLDNELISQIAAGEVIERPASVVKELLENSIDAGATKIAIEIEDGGLTKIRVVDNGFGIPSSQARLAFQRHATSKISKIDDLFAIGSLGFRGEALASVASVSRVVMRSYSIDEKIGVELEIDGGKEVGFFETACPIGTDITVLGLFHHTPARKKYMKTERTEYGKIFEIIVQLALTKPEVGFKLKRDGKEVLDLPEKQDVKGRVRSLFGGVTANALIPVTYQQSNLIVSGFVGKPELSRSSNKYQFVFVNGRTINSRLIAQAVKDGFHSLLMHEKYPWYLLDIQIDPQFVDVNVHPRKFEVKFVNQNEIFKVVSGAVYHALENATLNPIEGSLDFLSGEREKNNLGPNLSTESLRNSVPPETRAFSPLSMFESKQERGVFEVGGTYLRPVAQIANSYIVAESEEGLVLIDQHAAHERVRYMQLMDNLEKESPKSQKLITGLELDLGADSVRLANEYLEDFVALGFELEHFGENSFLLRAVPAGMENKDPEKIVMEIIADVTDEWKQNHVKNIREVLLTYTACRGAIKFGDSLSMQEMIALMKEMEKTKHSSHCPHGRPAIVTLTFDKLETLFKRKNF